MSSTQQSPAEQPARRVSYPPTEHRADHRLRSGYVPLITSVIVVAAAAVAAAVVFGTGEPTRSVQPGEPGVTGGLLPTADTPAQSPAGRSAGLRQAPRPPSPPAELSVAGVPLTLARGWRVVDQSPDRVVATDRDNRSVFVLQAENVDAGEIGNVTDLLRAWAEQVTQDLTNARIEPGNPLRGMGKRFPEAQTASYSGNLQSQSGTMPLFGELAVLWNRSTGDAALIDYVASTESDFEANLEDAKDMLSSITS